MKTPRLTLGARLGLGFVAVLALLTGMAVFTALSLQRIVSLQDRLEATSTRHVMARQWEAAVQLNLARALAIARSDHHAGLAASLKPQMKTTSARISTLQDQLVGTAGGDETALMDAVGAKRRAYLDLRDRLMADASTTAEQVDANLLPASDAYLGAVAALAQHVADRAARDSDALKGEARRTGTLLLVLAAAALVTGALTAWLITRSLTRPLRQAVDVAQRVAAGDLARPVVTDRHDELGELLLALAHMQQQLRRIIGEVRASSDSIATGSNQIATGNADLSQRTEEQASNLQQTAASMEELTVTVRNNADTARQASELAAGARDVARQGGEAVARVVATMDDITARSRRMADIVGVIDSIAFQTNLLALNAAVEAARAGTQGRGFAVVAGEVRTLARRSAEAAREIKDLIGSSVGAVETGRSLVDAAGTTMAEIVARVQHVGDLIAEISVAGAEQSDGITQIGQAVVQLDQVTQHNAALVEQSAAAAESLSEQSARLARTVALFRLDASSTAVARTE